MGVVMVCQMDGVVRRLWTKECDDCFRALDSMTTNVQCVTV